MKIEEAPLPTIPQFNSSVTGGKGIPRLSIKKLTSCTSKRRGKSISPCSVVAEKLVENSIDTNDANNNNDLIVAAANDSLQEDEEKINVVDLNDDSSNDTNTITDNDTTDDISTNNSSSCDSFTDNNNSNDSSDNITITCVKPAKKNDGGSLNRGRQYSAGGGGDEKGLGCNTTVNITVTEVTTTVFSSCTGDFLNVLSSGYSSSSKSVNSNMCSGVTIEDTYSASGNVLDQRKHHASSSTLTPSCKAGGSSSSFTSSCKTGVVDRTLDGDREGEVVVVDVGSSSPVVVSPVVVVNSPQVKSTTFKRLLNLKGMFR